MKGLKRDQFTSDREYQLAKKQLKKQTLSVRGERNKRSVKIDSVPTDLEMMYYDN